MLEKEVVRPSGPPHELAAAIRALESELRLRARSAERALDGADEGVRRLRREVDVAAFAAGAELEH
jgi:hypothetical protein